MCCIPLRMRDAGKFVTRIITQLSQVMYKAEYVPDNLLDEDTSPPLATPFRIAANAATNENAVSENEKVENKPAQAIRNAPTFTFVSFSPKRRKPKQYIVRSIVAKKSTVAVPISM